jgi:hypothetical protein
MIFFNSLLIQDHIVLVVMQHPDQTTDNGWIIDGVRTLFDLFFTGNMLPFTAIYERKSVSVGFTVPRQKRPIGYST